MRKLEHEFPDVLVVVGVHAGKYHAERVTANIWQAVQRFEMEHPVVNDRFFRIWRSYAVSAWPTIVLVDPEGRVVVTRPGEITAEMLAPAIRSLAEEHERRGTLRREPIAEIAPPPPPPAGPLAFPAKVLATPDGRLFIADSNHNRVLVARLSEDGASAEVVDVIGDGRQGLLDGPFDSARLNHPHGMALDPAGERLYIADMENHAVREADLAAGRLRTIAGTGEQARSYSRGGHALEEDLSSPWDVLWHAGDLYIAMAGVHQIWRLEPDGTARPWAGSGREAIIDAPLMQAALAQTSGLTTDGTRLYFVEPESSAVRWAEFERNAMVRTVVGTDLFDFGDVDGAGDDVRLQHPQGIAWHAGTLFVADTYNNKIKTVDPATRRSETFLGSGAPGDADGAGESAAFYEPGVVSAAGGRLYIADTNSHKVRVADIESRRVWTLDLMGI